MNEEQYEAYLEWLHWTPLEDIFMDLGVINRSQWNYIKRFVREELFTKKLELFDFSDCVKVNKKGEVVIKNQRMAVDICEDALVACTDITELTYHIKKEYDILVSYAMGAKGKISRTDYNTGFSVMIDEQVRNNNLPECLAREISLP